jgi:ABC-type nitrate/sulfonate/bicarbonate transport system substrate-binding protein
MLTRRSFLNQGLRGVGGAVALGGAPALLAACGNSTKSNSSAATSGGTAAATFQLGWIANVENMGEFVADDKGYYAAEKLAVKLVPGGPGIAVEPLLVSGKALMALSAPDIVSQARAQGAKLKIIAATFQKNPSAMMSLAKSPIASPKDMVGKKIGIQPSGNVIYNAFFKANGIDPKSIKKVPVQFDPSPLVDGEVDGFASFQTNQPIQLEEEGVDTKTFLLADFGYSLFTDCCVVTDETLADKAKRATVVKMLRATIKGWQDAIAAPADAAELVVTKYGKSLGLKVKSQTMTAKAEVPLISTPDTDAHGLLTMTDAMIAANVDTLQSVGIKTTADDLFDTSVLEEVYQGKNRV